MIGERQQQATRRQQRVVDCLGTHPRSLWRVTEDAGGSTSAVHKVLKALAEKGLARQTEMVTGGLGWRRA